MKNTSFPGHQKQYIFILCNNKGEAEKFNMRISKYKKAVTQQKRGKSALEIP